MTWRITIHGKPATKGSTVSFLSRDGRIVTRTDAVGLVPWTDAVRWACREAGVQMAAPESPVWLGVTFIAPRPKRTRRAFPSVRPDVDKWSRALLDALTGMAYADDAQVVTLHASKRYGDTWQTCVEIDTSPADARHGAPTQEG